MKWLIALLLLTTIAFAVDPADALENKYVDVLLKYKTEYDGKCHKLSLAYIASLEKRQVATVKKGDLDGALKIKGKIVEIKKMLENNLPVTIPNAIPSPKTITLDPVVGHYKRCLDQGKVQGWNVRVNPDKTFDILFLNNKSKNYSGKWEKDNGIYTFTFPHATSFTKVTFKNGSLIGKHYHKGKVNQAERIWTQKTLN